MGKLNKIMSTWLEIRFYDREAISEEKVEEEVACVLFPLAHSERK